MDRDNASTATQANHGMTRRGVMRRTAIGVGAAATLGAASTGTVAAINLPSRDTIKTAAGFAISPPLMGAKYIYDRVTDPGTGDDVNDQLQDLNSSEAHASARQDALEMKSVDDRVLTSINNVIQGLDRRSYQKGIETAIARLDAGDSEANVKSKAVSDAMSVISTTQKNIVDHYGIQASKFHRLVAGIQSQSGLSVTTVFQYYNRSDDVTTLFSFPGSATTATVTLADSTTYTHDCFAYENSNGVRAIPIDDRITSAETIRSNPVDTGSTEIIFDQRDFDPIWTTTTDIASTVTSEVESWVTQIYPSYSSGDIDLSQLVTADQLAATASEQNDLTNVTADFASLGIPINNRTTLTIEIVAGENSGTIIDGNLAVRNPPTDGFIVGDTYDPANITGPVWLMYDRTTDSGETEGDVYKIESQFKVIDAEGYDGEPVSNVTFEEKTQERYSTDIQELNAQLDELAEYQQEIQKERDALIEEEATSGGGGGFLDGVGQGYSIGLAAVAAGVLYIIGSD